MEAYSNRPSENLDGALHEIFTQEARMKIINTLIAILSLALFSTWAFGEAVHLPQAIEHTQLAIKDGEAGKAAGLSEHATIALEHANASEKAEANPHTTEGIVHLKAAIETGKKGDAPGATAHAKEALKHLDLAKTTAKK
jgi:Small metal-binding protein